jgi:effector-binding domain-containing protein
MSLTYEVRTEELRPTLTAVVRGEMPAAQMSAWLPDAYAAVFDYLRRAGVPPAAPPFARLTFLGDTVAIEAGVPVLTEVAGDGRVQASSLPEGPAAITTHVGRYEDVEHALDAVTRWLAGRGLQSAGPHWEVYYTDPTTEPDSDRWRTDVVVPYRVNPSAHVG